ncbi:hypothetical protein [Trichlorobacter lovleyi]|uniref:hypothetical protein n=1 Tax=Trichlorobacter lovleyi TaxID=313985 RepID=UPI002480F8F1|nr:hypothetical protein [Trichlorobacter lovleyi]
MSKKIEQMNPQQIRERGRELLRLAQQKETEIRNRQLVQIGQIFQREIQGGWVTPWRDLQKELQDLLGVPVTSPAWGFNAGVQGGAQAPLVEVDHV